jgi:hypothetical protein
MRPPLSRWIALALALAGGAGILAVVGRDGLPLVLGWLVALGICAAAACLMRSRPRRIVAAIALPLAVPACLLLTFEGGWFFLPALLAFLWGEAEPELRRYRATAAGG